MAKKPRIEGAKEVKARLKTIDLTVKERRIAAVVRGMLGIKRDSMRNSPVREGNLRASAFMIMPYGEEGVDRPFRGKNRRFMAAVHPSAKATTIADVRAKAKKGVAAAVGHSAVYALPIHELPWAGARGYISTFDRKITRGPRKGRKRRAEEVHSKVGGWKFLERAIRGNKKRVQNLLKAASDSGIKSGAKK